MSSPFCSDVTIAGSPRFSQVLPGSPRFSQVPELEVLALILNNLEEDPTALKDLGEPEKFFLTDKQH